MWLMSAVEFGPPSYTGPDLTKLGRIGNILSDREGFWNSLGAWHVGLTQYD